MLFTFRKNSFAIVNIGLICRQFYSTENVDEKKLMQDIAKYTEPIRPGRSDERNLKAKSFFGFTYRVSI